MDDRRGVRWHGRRGGPEAARRRGPGRRRPGPRPARVAVPAVGGPAARADPFDRDRQRDLPSRRRARGANAEDPLGGPPDQPGARVAAGPGPAPFGGRARAGGDGRARDRLPLPVAGVPVARRRGRPRRAGGRLVRARS